MRGRGWVLWKNLITIAGADAPPGDVLAARRVLGEVLAG